MTDSIFSYTDNLMARNKHILETVFDPDMTCTWSLYRDCGCHKINCMLNTNDN